MEKEILRAPDYKIVQIGNIILYVYQTQISLSRNIHEKSDVSGNAYISNSSHHLAAVKIKAKIHLSDDTQSCILAFDSAVRTGAYYNFRIGNISISSAQIKQADFSESISSQFVEAELIFVTDEGLKAVENEQHES